MKNTHTTTVCVFCFDRMKSLALSSFVNSYRFTMKYLTVVDFGEHSWHLSSKKKRLTDTGYAGCRSVEISDRCDKHTHSPTRENSRQEIESRKGKTPPAVRSVFKITAVVSTRYQAPGVQEGKTSDWKMLQNETNHV